MPLKTIIDHDGSRYALLGENDQPIYEVDGSDVSYDGESLARKISDRNAESERNRKELESLRQKLKSYDGIDDAEAARKALELASNLEDQKLVEAGQVESIKRAAIEATEDKYKKQIKSQYDPIIAERDQLKADLHKEMVSSKFAGSRYIREKLSVPSEMVEATFSSHFSVEDGKLVIRDASGSQIYSRNDPGSPAGFDEALELIIQAYPHRDQILSGPSNRGSGNRDDQGGGNQTSVRTGQLTMTRGEADKLAIENPALMMQRMTDPDPSKRYRVVDQAH